MEVNHIIGEGPIFKKCDIKGDNLCITGPTKNCIILQFGFAVCLFVRKLLCHLRTNRHQTRQEGWG